MRPGATLALRQAGPVGTTPRPVAPFLAALFLAALAIGWALDHRPRFMMGDSYSYLTAGLNGHYPPDRSWIYGLLARRLLEITHGLQAAMGIGLLLLAAVAWMAAGLLGASARHAGWAALPLLAGLALDPLIQTYVRFSLSDLWAACAFLVFVLALALCAAGRRPAALLWGLAVAGCLSAVLLRVAYAPIGAVAVILYVASLLPRAEGWRDAGRLVVGRGVAALLVPVLAWGVLVEANHLVLRDAFPGQYFANRLSGTFLMGVFAPAIVARDIRAAGIAIEDRDVAAMRLGDYHNRSVQVWGAEDFWLRRQILLRSHAEGEYDARADALCGRIVRAAFLRAPLSVLGVYLHGFVLYAEPAEWSRQFPAEMGQDRPLPPELLGVLESRGVRGLTPASPQRGSLWPVLLRSGLGAYPWLLGLAGLAAIATLAARSQPAARVVAAALLADLLLVPLYSSDVIPRYLLAADMLGWVLAALGLAALLRRPSRSRRAVVFA